MPFPNRSAALTLAILSALSFAGASSARNLGNFDINAESAKSAQTQPTGPTRAGTDAIGRATFTWVQQPLPAGAKAVGNPEAAARAHLAQLTAHAKHAPAAVDTLTDARVDRQHGGAALVRLQPRLDGIAIFHEEVALLLDAQQQLVAMRGPLPRNTQDNAKSLPMFVLDAPQAVAAALAGYDFEAKVANQLVPTGKQGEYYWYRLDRSVKSHSGAVSGEWHRARPVYFRTGAGLQPAWYVETQVADDARLSTDAYAHVISAVDGSTLFRVNQTAHATTPYTYKVWAEEGPIGLPFPTPQGRALTPDPDGLPSNDQAPFVAQQSRTLANIPFSQAATDGWLPAGATVTSGNNAIAYADRAEPNGLGAGDLQPGTTAPGVFDYTFNGALAPTANETQSKAAAVQLFYWVNWLHDWFYDHGFAEIDGNAQVDNFGRGGLGGDAIRAEAQDYDVSNNANMSTPADGGPPRMQMGLLTTTPVTDYTLDGRTVAHEWGHYLSNRLIGDGSGLDSEHAGGMGEGWSDFVAQLVLVKEEDKQKPGNATFGGVYGGGYVDHSYYGVRRYGLSTDMSKSPLTLRHIADGLALPTAPPPAGGADGANNSEVHNQGEIWAAALWEAYAALLNDTPRLSFTQAQTRMMNYLVAGMKLTPVSPTMLEARDAILAVALANGETRDFELFTVAFAKRGMGAGAHIPNRHSTNMAGTVESTALGSDIEVTSSALGLPTGCDADTVLDLGESANLRIDVANSGFAAVTGASVSLSSDNPALVFPQGDTVALGTLPLLGEASVSIPLQLATAVEPNTPIRVTATPTAPAINSPPGIAGTTLLFVNFDELAASSATEAFDGATTNWQAVRMPDDSGSGTWSNQLEGSNKVLHGDDTNSNAVTWAESPTMAVGPGPLVLSLRHRHAFEFGAGEAYDGGLIQASTDGGTTWIPLDATAAGYGIIELSDCCGNPLAGQKAYISKNTGYPNYSTRTIDLGTAFANQSNFRLRFGVATDAAVTRGGWDIDSVAVSGLANTPFTSLVAQASSCSTANLKSLQGAMSGTYYSTARSGEGVLVDFGQVGTTPVAFFSWYTYDGGEQQWMVGSSPFALTDQRVEFDLIETRGTGFGTAFQSQDVITEPWGSAAISFPTCDTMELTYQKAGGETGTLTLNRGLERLAQGQCNVLHGGLSGTYYSSARSGEGVLVDFGHVGGTPVEFFSWYTYDGGEQKWLVGSQPFNPTDATVGVDLIETRGADFGSAFRREDVVTTPWGRVTQRFIDCDTLELTYAKNGGESGTLTLNRGLQQLGDGVCR